MSICRLEKMALTRWNTKTIRGIYSPGTVEPFPFHWFCIRNNCSNDTKLYSERKQDRCQRIGLLERKQTILLHLQKECNISAINTHRYYQSSRVHYLRTDRAAFCTRTFGNIDSNWSTVSWAVPASNSMWTIEMQALAVLVVPISVDLRTVCSTPMLCHFSTVALLWNVQWHMLVEFLMRWKRMQHLQKHRTNAAEYGVGPICCEQMFDLWFTKLWSRFHFILYHDFWHIGQQFHQLRKQLLPSNSKLKKIMDFREEEEWQWIERKITRYIWDHPIALIPHNMYTIPLARTRATLAIQWMCVWLSRMYALMSTPLYSFRWASPSKCQIV